MPAFAWGSIGWKVDYKVRKVDKVDKKIERSSQCTERRPVCVDERSSFTTAEVVPVSAQSAPE